MNKVPVESLVNLEEPLIKVCLSCLAYSKWFVRARQVPLEQFKKASRSAQRLVEKELGSLVTALQDLESTSSSEANKKSPQEVAAVLESFETRIKGLKRKVR